MAILKVPVTEEDHIQGNLNAPVILVEYGDYECPFCTMAFPVIKKIQEHFGEQLCFVFRNFPLSEVHPFAEIAAETAEFAGLHRRYWAMHDLIYANNRNLSSETLFELAKNLGFSTMELEQAIQNHTFMAKIKEDFLGGVRSGVNGTPTFFINENRYNGPFDYDRLTAAIDTAMPSKTY